MKRIAIGAVLLLSLAGPALAEPPVPATTALPTAVPASPDMGYLRPTGTIPAPTHVKKHAAASSIASPTSLYPLSFGQLQDQRQREFEEVFHIDHSG